MTQHSTRCAVYLVRLDFVLNEVLLVTQFRQIAAHGEPSSRPARVVVVGQAEFFACFLDDGRNFGVAINGHGRKQVVLNLVIETAGEPIPKRRRGSPVGRGNHLFERPVRLMRRERALVLNVINNKNIFEVLPANDHECHAQTESTPNSEIVSGNDDMANEPKRLKEENLSPIGGCDNELHTSNLLVDAGLEISKIPLDKPETHPNNRGIRLKLLHEIVLDLRVESEHGVANLAVVVLANFIGIAVVGVLVLVHPNQLRRSRNVHEHARQSVHKRRVVLTGVISRVH